MFLLSVVTVLVACLPVEELTEDVLVVEFGAIVALVTVVGVAAPVGGDV